MNISLLINGSEATAEADATFDRIDPVTGEVATTAAAAKKEDAIAAVEAADRAFSEWSAKGPGERRAVLLKAADLLDARTEDFIRMMCTETGATGPWAGFNVMLAANMLREAGAMTTQVKGSIIPSDKPGTLSMAVREPVGVCVGIAPWNAPVILGVRAVAMPLACGNTVVFKASEMCPATHRLIGEVLTEAGLPKGAINVVTHAAEDAPEVVEALVAHPAVRRINFTGSTRVGKIIAKQAAEHLKPVLLELGGKAPLVILDDADVDGAVNAAAFGAFMNQGQICMSTEKIVVDEKVADEFAQKFAEKANALPAGNPREQVVLGSVVDKAAVERVKELLEDALEKGAKQIAGETPEGVIMKAIVVDKVTPEMRLYQEESFAPIVGIVRVNGVDEAVAKANDTEYGLSAAVFGKDVQRALSVARRIRSGICHVNGPTVHDEAQMPFGGVKQSGYGRFGGDAALNEFTELRWITVGDSGQHYPF